VRILASKSTMRLLLIQRVMGRLREPMLKPSRVPRHTHMTARRSLVTSGLTSFHAHYGITGHLQTGPRGRCLSSWCMGLKLLSPQKLPLPFPMFRNMTKSRRTNSGVMMSTLLMNEDGKQLSKMHGITRRFNAIISSLCIAGSSGWMICCSVTNYHVKC
jgi:hypothetical protein